MALEKRIKRLEANRRAADGSQNFMGKAWSCKNTLAGANLGGSSGDTERSFEIKAIKDSAGNTVWNFAKTSGKLTDSATKERLKSLGIDDFESLKFIYESASPAEGRIVLSSRTAISGLLEGKNPDIIWELSGIKVETKAAETGPPALAAGDRVTACRTGAVHTDCPAGAACSRHTNPDGSEGGIVAATATVASTATVGKNARVLDRAQVLDNAQVLGNAKISGNAKVSGDARVEGNTWVYGDAEVSGNAKVYGDARVRADARVYGRAKVYETAQIDGDAMVFGDAEVSGDARVYGNAGIYSDARVYGNASVYGNAAIFNNAEVYGKAIVFGDSWIFDRARVYGAESLLVFGDARIYGDAKVYNESAWGAVRVGGMAHVSGSKKVCSGQHYTSGQVASQPSCP